MIFEHRTYEVASGRMDELVERFEKHTLRLFSKYGIEPVLFCMPKDNIEKNVFFYIVKFENEEQMEKCWKSFLEDEERIKIWDESNKKGKLVLSIDSKIFDSIDLI